METRTARKPKSGTRTAGSKRPACACGKPAVFVCDHCKDDVCSSCFGANCCVDCVEWEKEHEKEEK